jgi:hypothetical protein
MGLDANIFPLVLDGLLLGIDASAETLVGFDEVGLNVVIAPVVVEVVSMIKTLPSTILQSILLYTSKGGQLFNV